MALRELGSSDPSYKTISRKIEDLVKEGLSSCGNKTSCRVMSSGDSYRLLLSEESVRYSRELKKEFPKSGFRLLVGDFNRDGFEDVALIVKKSVRIFLGDEKRLIQPKPIEARPVSASGVQPPIKIKVDGLGGETERVRKIVEENLAILRENFPRDGRINPFIEHRSTVATLGSAFVVGSLQAAFQNLGDEYGAYRNDSAGLDGYQLTMIMSRGPFYDGYAAFTAMNMIPVDSPDVPDFQVNGAINIVLVNIEIKEEDLRDPHLKEKLLIQMACRLVESLPQMLTGRFRTATVLSDGHNPAALFVQQLIQKLPGGYDKKFIAVECEKILKKAKPI